MPGPGCYHRAMQEWPAAPRRRGSRSASRRDVLKCALAAPVLFGLGAAVVARGAQEASAAGIQLIDFAERRILPEEIVAAGYSGVVQYVSESRPGANFEAKPLTRQYADALRAAGLEIVSNYQYGKPGWPTPSDFTRGYDGGVADAQTALRIHDAAGGSGSAPIFFSVDEVIDENTWNTVAVKWFRGINSVLGVDRTGIYGHFLACGWAIEDGVVGRSTTPGHWWVWQTAAWSQGEREPRAVLYQAVVDNPESRGPLLGGIHVDVDDVLATDYGQWTFDR